MRFLLVVLLLCIANAAHALDKFAVASESAEVTVVTRYVASVTRAEGKVLIDFINGRRLALSPIQEPEFPAVAKCDPVKLLYDVVTMLLWKDFDHQKINRETIMDRIQELAKGGDPSLSIPFIYPELLASSLRAKTAKIEWLAVD